MPDGFLHAPLGSLAPDVCRIGFSASYRPGRETVHRAIDEGIGYYFYYGFDTHLTRVLPGAIGSRRERFVLATGAYNYIWAHQNLRRTLERRLRQMKTDYIDLFHFLGITRPSHLTARVREELQAVRESGLVRGVAVSCHDRKFAAELLRAGTIDAAMIRYNAAHRGAETEIFPLLPEPRPPLVAYTATCWTMLLRRPRGYPRGAPLPDAAMCYRFALSNPAISVCLMAPKNLREFEANLAGVRRGPLDEEEAAFLRSFGDRVHWGRA